MRKKKWIFKLLTLVIVIALIIFLGSIFFNLTAYIFDFFKIVSGWLATASRWLAKLFDWFGWCGTFTAWADCYPVIETTKLMIGG